MTNSFYNDYGFASKKKSNKHKIVWIILSFILAGILCLVIIFSSVEQNKKTIFGKTFFAISLGFDSAYEKAEILSDKVENDGAGGYIYVDDVSYVLAFAYVSKADALKVMEKIEDYTCSIIEIEIDLINKKYISTELLSLSKIIDKYSCELYDFAIDFDKGEKNSSEIIKFLYSIRLEYNSLLSSLSINEDEKSIAFQSYFVTLLEEIDDILKESDKQKLSSFIKHLYLTMLFEASSLVLAINE